MRYSVTGIQHPTMEQVFAVLHPALRELNDVNEFSTGGAYGIDTYAALWADMHLEDARKRLIYPANLKWNDSLLDLDFQFIVPIYDGYLRRNDELVVYCDVLLAFPATRVEVLRSGTWSTIRRARKAGKEVRIYPLNGTDHWREDWSL